MGICSSQDKKKKHEEEGPLQFVPLQAQKYQTTEAAQGENRNEQVLQKHETAKQEMAKPDTKQLENQPDQIYDEEIFVNDIMKQFDDLNHLFNQMASEFDQISQYLQSMSGIQDQQ